MSADEKVEIQKREYLLTVKVRFEAIDDADARKKASEMNTGCDPSNVANVTSAETKLQRLQKNGPPEKVEL